MPPRQSSNIPDIVIGRLPLYLRALRHFKKENQEVTSSHELGQHLGISSAQIRKDLSHFGGFGKQGTGYHIKYLEEKLREVLKVDREWEVVLIGAGDLGNAIAHYRGFADRGYHISCIFDDSPEKVGKEIAGLTTQSMDKLHNAISQKNIKMAMIAVPAANAQEVANELVEAGVRAILNYAPISLKVPEDVYVEYIDPVTHLQHMSYYLD